METSPSHHRANSHGSDEQSLLSSMNTSETTFSEGLLRLPTEITVSILRHLLAENEPLDSISVKGHKHCPDHFNVYAPAAHLNCWVREAGHNFAFHPKVLRTCQRLHKEGITVLYCENRIRLHGFHDRWSSGFVFLEQDQYVPEHMQLGLLKKFPNLEIEIHSFREVHQLPTYFLEATELVQWAGNFATRLVETIGSERKNITVNIEAISGPSRSTIRDWARTSKLAEGTGVLECLSTLRLLRASQIKVFFHGELISPPPEWAQFTLSNEHDRGGFLDLFEMYKRLRKFCMTWRGSLDRDEQILFTNTLLEWDAKAFIALRDKMLESTKRTFSSALLECVAAG